MSQISMEEKLSDLKKVILELSNVGSLLVSENEKQYKLLIEKDKHISDLQEQVDRIYADNDETIKSNTDLQRANAEFKRENKYLSDENEKLDEENKKLSREISKLKEENKDLLKTKRKFDEQIGKKKSSLQNELDTANARIVYLKNQLENQQQMNIYMRSLLTKIGEVQKNIDSLKNNGENDSDYENNEHEKTSSDMSESDRDYISNLPEHLQEQAKEDLFDSRTKKSDEENQTVNTHENPETQPTPQNFNFDDTDSSEADGSDEDNANGDTDPPVIIGDI